MFRSDEAAVDTTGHLRQPSALEGAQAAVLSAPGRFIAQPQSAPAELGPNEVLVRLQGCGICASSLPLWQGRPWFDYPLPVGAPGHEGWGEIVAAGKQVDSLHCGQRVTFLGGSAFAGLMAVLEDEAVILPDALAGQPFPGEAIACAMNIFRRADVRPDQHVCIIGAGFLGLLLVQLCVSAGAQVIVFSRRQSVLDMAMSHGAAHTFTTDNWGDTAQQALNLTAGRGFERVIEAVGLQFALELATELIGEYGRLVIAGYHQDGVREVNMQQWNWKALDVINAHERDPRNYVQGIHEGIDATLSGRISPQRLLTHRFSLEELNLAFSMMQERPDGFVKGWLKL